MSSGTFINIGARNAVALPIRRIARTVTRANSVRALSIGITTTVRSQALVNLSSVQIIAQVIVIPCETIYKTPFHTRLTAIATRLASLRNLNALKASNRAVVAPAQVVQGALCHVVTHVIVEPVARIFIRLVDQCALLPGDCIVLRPLQPDVKS